MLALYYLLHVEYIHSHLWMMHQNDKRNATLSPLGNVYTSNRHFEIKNYCGDITVASARGCRSELERKSVCVCVCLLRRRKRCDFEKKEKM